MEKEQKSVLENYQQEMEPYKSVEQDKEKKSDPIPVNDAPSKDSSGCLGCLKFGCVGLLIIVGLLIVTALVCVWFVRKYATTFAEEYLSLEQSVVPSVATLSGSYEELTKKMSFFTEDSDLLTGVSVFTDDEINYYLQHTGTDNSSGINAYVVFSGEEVEIQFGIPVVLTDPQKYLNGFLVVHLDETQNWHGAFLSGVINGNPIEQKIFDFLESILSIDSDSSNTNAYVHDSLLYIEKK